jgi:serine/threonine-protein kinase
MATPLPPHDAKVAQLAVKFRLSNKDQVRAAVDLYRRYEAAGGEIPSLARILVQKGTLTRELAELLLRHVIRGEPLPERLVNTASSIASGVKAQMAPPPQPTQAPSTHADREQQMMLKGLGATVLRGEIKGYKILNVIGEGSMGTVYKAHQVSMDRIVALKVLTHTKNQAFVEQFLTEARNAGRLNHPNLIRVHEVGKSGDLYYYSMEFVDGRLDPKRAVNIFLQIAAALDHGSRLGIIHREIRPKSIMITEGDQAKLDGLGLVKDEVTRFLMGENAHYVSPEQAKGLDPDTRSDIYSLGCCLFHSLAGEPPFMAPSPKDVLAKRLMEEPANLLEVNPGVPHDLAAICRKMMDPDPSLRFQLPAELVEALKRVSFGPPPRPGTARGRPPVMSTGHRARIARRRHRFRR